MNSANASRHFASLPLPYSLALRLRDAGVAADVICQYVNVEQAALDGLYRIAEAKLTCGAENNNTTATMPLTQPSAPSFGPRGPAPPSYQTADDAGHCRLRRDKQELDIATK